MKKKVLLGIKIAVSAGVLGYLLRQVDLSQLKLHYSLLNIVLLLLPLLILIVQISLSTLKWRIILGAERLDVPYLFLWKSYSISNFISLFLPTSFGGDVYRVYSLKRYNLDLIQNASSVAFDRITGLFALTSIAVFSNAIFYEKVIGYPFLFLYGIGIILFWYLSADKTLGYLEQVRYTWLRPLKRIFHSFNKYRSDRRVLWKSLLISLLFQNNIIWIVKFYCMALGVNIGIQFLYMIVPVIYLTEALPISINGLGLREGAFVFFFIQLGHTKEEAIAVSLLVIAMRYLVATLLGGSLLATSLLRLGGNEEEQKVMPG
jgi:uncharacterized protein (TIRG00374 family)